MPHAHTGRRAAAATFRPRRRALPALAAAALFAPSAASAREEVDMLLALATDASGGIGADGYRLQREGYAEALSHPAVLAAIASKPHGAVAVAVVEWGSPGGAATVLDWTRLSPDAASARGLAGAVLAAPRSEQSWNALGDALDHCARLIHAAPFQARERVIDISGNGPDLRSLRPAPAARDDAVAAGITINALAVSSSGRATRTRELLVESYRREVIGGPGAFVVAAEGGHDFARALRAKLVREIT